MDFRPKIRCTVNGCFGFQHYKQSNQRPFIPRINSSLASAATREQGNSVRDKPFFCFFQKIEGGQNPGSTLAKGGGPFSIPWPSAGNIKVVLGSRCSMPGFKLGHGFHGFSRDRFLTQRARRRGGPQRYFSTTKDTKGRQTRISRFFTDLHDHFLILMICVHLRPIPS